MRKTLAADSAAALLLVGVRLLPSDQGALLLLIADDEAVCGLVAAELDVAKLIEGRDMLRASPALSEEDD